MKRVIYISRYDTSRATGHGGFHRSYQIRHDLQAALGPENVIALDNPWSFVPEAPKNGLGRFVAVGLHYLQAWSRNPYRMLTGLNEAEENYAFPDLEHYYERLLVESSEPPLCIIDHPGFASLLPISNRHGVATISCTHNVEAFDVKAASFSNKWTMHAHAVDFAAEARFLSCCAERLFISRVEVGLIGGLGLSARYYPYMPVGAIRESSEQIRYERGKGDIDPSLFLMVGTAGHHTTRDSFKWFLQAAKEHGLPSGVRIVIVGLGTEQLLAAGDLIPGVELRGWVDQEELDRLLARAGTVLVPQLLGFGALTRLPELACAGVPCIVSRHPTYALNPPPGLEIVEDDWECWYAAMSLARQGARAISTASFQEWEARQENGLVDTVRRVLGIPQDKGRTAPGEREHAGSPAGSVGRPGLGTLRG